MSSSTVEEPLPPSWGSYGYVVGRVIQAVGDDADTDDLPGAKPVTGSGLVTFTSLDGTRVVTDSDSGQTAVIPQAITCDLDEDGYISMQSKRGIWLWAGNWKVSWGSQVGLPSWSYTVLGTETATAPLQVMSKMGVTPPSGAVITTVKIDASTQPGQALTLDGTGAVVVGVDRTTLKGDPGDLMPVSTATWSGAVSLTPTGPATIRATLTGNVTLTLGAGTAGVSYTVTLDLRQDTVGSRLLTIRGAGTSYAVPIALQTAANSRDIVHLLWTGSDWVALLGAPAVGIPTSWSVS